MKKVMRVSMALVLLTYAGLMNGQATNSGDITGTVTDPSGAVVPGVTVAVLDVDKNITHTYMTNDAGVYDTGSIVPDHYKSPFPERVLRP